MQRNMTVVAVALSALLFSACTGGGGGTDNTTPSATYYSLSGTISGLQSGSTLVLKNGSKEIKVAKNGGFVLQNAVEAGTVYSVAIKTVGNEPNQGQPVLQKCSIANAQGTATGDVSNVAVSCKQEFFFEGRNETSGYELFKTDGTEAGTVMVKDINPSGNAGARYITAVGNTIYFQASSDNSGYRELWKTDGTETGTVMVKDINPTADAFGFTSLAAIGETLYFTADDGNGTELWKSDGTEAGTVMVKDIMDRLHSLEQRNPV